MGSGILYSRIAKIKENVKKRRFVKTMFLAGIFLFGLHFNSLATPPTFAVSSPQPISVCQDAIGGLDISSLLAVNEADAGHPLTWTISLTPGSGSLTGSYSATAMTGATTPVPANTFMYAPTPGVNGSDILQITVTNDSAESATMTILITINELPSLTLGAQPAVCAGAASATLSFSGNTNIGSIHNIFNPGYQPWTVPAGITSINFEALGGAGGGDSHSGTPNPGKGGRVTGMISVTPNTQLFINVGGAGSGTTGGFNGGGDSYCFGTAAGCGGAGGGATDIRMGGSALSNRIVVAGGGGGNGSDISGAHAGGDGGGLTAANAADNAGGSHAGAGGQLTPGNGAALAGWTPGNPGAFGIGGNASMQGNSGGGGGGYYGGGGGVWSGGGGGSSYTDPSVVSLVSHTQGFNDGDGLLAIDYTIQGNYSITWDPLAIADGFTNVVNDQFPSSASSFTIAIPSGAVPGTIYSGTLKLDNGTCTSVDYPITITINDNPNIDPLSVSGVSVCNGDMSTLISPVLINTAVTATYQWSNDNIYTGLGTNGSGDILPFAATNPGTAPITATITYTATSTDGCVGVPATFVMTVNPTPKLANTLTPVICNLTAFDYPDSSLTAGTVFQWKRDSVADFSNFADSGFTNPNQVLVNLTNHLSTVDYVYTLQANACINTQTVTVSVNPTMILSSSHTPAAVCNTTLFNYPAASLDPSSTVALTWSRATVPGLTNPANSGSGNPMENLENVYTDSIAVTYVYTLTETDNGCFNTDNVTVVVYPSPVLSSSHLAGPICSGSLFVYTPTSATPGATFQWNRQVQYGIKNPGMTSVGGIRETLEDTISSPVNVLYYYDVYIGGCSNRDSMTVTVNPAPGLTSPRNHSQCDNTMFSYTPTSLAPGAVFNWIRLAAPGIANPAVAGSGPISDVLVNDSAFVSVVSYAFITSSPGGCVNTNDTVKVTVKPDPQLSSTLNPTAVCDSSGFAYVPASRTSGTTFNWSRLFVTGISNPAATGSGPINELLENPTNVAVNLNYVFTLSANGCAGTPQNVRLTVKPRPKISSPLQAIVCSGTPFSYTPTSFTAGTRFDWTRPIVANLNPQTSFGVGSMLETLVSDIPTDPLTTVYNIRLTADGCVNNNISHLVVTVNGTPPNVNIVTNTPPGICSKTQYENFGASVPPPAGVRYDWKGFNAAVYAVDNTHQYALVNFPQPGTAYVEVTSKVLATGCITKNSLKFDVFEGVADNPKVVYYNTQFVCTQSSVASYQWGYDDAATLTSTTLVGETSESYNNENPDFAHKHYWCIVTANGCSSKAYYNVPTGVQDLHTGDAASVKVFPNPANDKINVEISSSAGGKMQVEILNMLGQQINMVPATDNKADINVSGLPAGGYLVNCYSDGVKIASSRFIKN